MIILDNNNLSIAINKKPYYYESHYRELMKSALLVFLWLDTLIDVQLRVPLLSKNASHLFTNSYASVRKC